jgi:hypothetical protein
VGEILEYLKVRFNGRDDHIASSLAEIQLSIHEWYPTWPVTELAARHVGSVLVV